MRTPLSPDEVLAQAPAGWAAVNGKLTLAKELASFPAALAFVQQVGELAEELDHHPDIDIRWCTVTLAVNTHDAGNAITAKDLQLASRVNALVA